MATAESSIGDNIHRSADCSRVSESAGATRRCGENRTYDQQVELKNRLGNGAATPGHSYHETGDALDFYSLSPEQLGRLNQLAQQVAAEYNIPSTWGGDWAKRDYVHFQVPRRGKAPDGPVGLSVMAAAKTGNFPRTPAFNAARNARPPAPGA